MSLPETYRGSNTQGSLIIDQLLCIVSDHNNGIILTTEELWEAIPCPLSHPVRHWVWLPNYHTSNHPILFKPQGEIQNGTMKRCGNQAWLYPFRCKMKHCSTAKTVTHYWFNMELSRLPAVLLRFTYMNFCMYSKAFWRVTSKDLTEEGSHMCPLPA